MRLTLRTMLAYLDDILEPSDAEQLGQKIEESKVASDLVHRIRNSTRRMRLGAPRPEGKGMGLDANTVAEYLDNTLPPPQVPDFEKVCLESDVHLSEVASCHQILTLVLGEPADIEHAVRERIYRLPQNNTGVDGKNESKSDAAQAEPPPPVAERPTPRVEPPPDSLPGKAPVPLKLIAITLLMAFLGAALTLRAIAPFDQDHPVWRAMVGSRQAEMAQADPLAEPNEPVAADLATARGVEESASSDRSTAAEAEAQAAPPEDTAEPTSVASDGDDAAANPPPPEIPAAVAAEQPAAPTEHSPPANTEETVDVTPSLEAPQQANSGLVEEPIDSKVEALSPTAPVGRYIVDGLLARQDAESVDWFTLPADAALSAGDHLLVLPTYRPQILLSPGIKVTFAGETSIRLLPRDESGAARLDVSYGRALIVPVGDTGNRIALHFGSRQASLMFGDPNSAAAVEVRRFLPAGADPESTAPQTVVLLYATSGQVDWQADGQALRLSAGQFMASSSSAETSLHDTRATPAWINNSDLSLIERRASRELREYITTDRSLNLALLERTEFRRQEVRALACRCLTTLEIFDPILKTLNDLGQRAYWPSHFDALRFSVARSKQSALRLRQTIEDLYGEEADDIYRLCWGYSPAQLQAGAAEELIGYLTSESMCIRVLAIWNLERISGMTHAFSASKTPDQERTRVARWRQSLQQGRVVYNEPPVAIPELLGRESAAVGNSEP